MASEVSYLLSTIDNPYSPFDEFDEWRTFDEKVLHYNSCDYLDRIKTALRNNFEELGETVSEDEVIDLAINEIVKYNVIGVYVKLNEEQANKLKERR